MFLIYIPPNISCFKDCSLVSKVSPGFPYAAIVPAPDLIDKCFKKKEMSIEARRDPFLIKGSQTSVVVAT